MLCLSTCYHFKHGVDRRFWCNVVAPISSQTKQWHQINPNYLSFNSRNIRAFFNVLTLLFHCLCLKQLQWRHLPFSTEKAIKVFSLLAPQTPVSSVATTLPLNLHHFCVSFIAVIMTSFVNSSSSFSSAFTPICYLLHSLQIHHKHQLLQLFFLHPLSHTSQIPFILI